MKMWSRERRTKEPNEHCNVECPDGGKFNDINGNQQPVFLESLNFSKDPVFHDKHTKNQTNVKLCD